MSAPRDTSEDIDYISTPKDPEPDWGPGLSNRIKLQRLLTLGYIWGIIAIGLGFFVFVALMMGWI